MLKQSEQRARDMARSFYQHKDRGAFVVSVLTNDSCLQALQVRRGLPALGPVFHTLLDDHGAFSLWRFSAALRNRDLLSRNILPGFQNEIQLGRVSEQRHIL